MSPPRLEREFGGFIHGPKLAGAVLAARKAACGEANAYLWGKAGSGKTHLLSAAANEARRNGVHVVGKMEGLPDRAALVVADDVEGLGKAEMQWLFETLKRVLHGDTKACVLVAGAEQPGAMDIRIDVKSRLQELPCFMLASLDDDELKEALCSHAVRLGHALPDSVAAVLVQRLPRDMASLASAMDELDAHAIANDLRLTAKVTHDWLDRKEAVT